MGNQAKLIDGKSLASSMRASVAEAVEHLKSEHSIIPGLAVVLVGNNQASLVYVRNKIIQTTQAGMNSFQYKLDESVGRQELLDLVDRLNEDPLVHGILVQLPLPEHIDANEVMAVVHSDKDVDGFHVVNAGLLNVGQGGIVPCTPLACVELLKFSETPMEGAKALIIGRSNIVGKPLSALLLRENCTVTVSHSRTQNLDEECRQADILVAAIGKPRAVEGNWIKPGATVVDVGINRIQENGAQKLVGDVDFDGAVQVAGAITPVPGGVGPMTIACLLKNTVQITCDQNSIPLPDCLC